MRAGAEAYACAHKLGIDSLDKLRAAAEAGQLQALYGFGPKMTATILAKLAALRPAERRRWADAEPVVEGLLGLIRAIDRGRSAVSWWQCSL
ncbi:MAG: hypothetical protein P3W87_008240 [Gammaproteobacteria bacterium]|nr:hypothetical protein [Gammaproteobacteria bacterium]